jgi:hypothetical protein
VLNSGIVHSDCGMKLVVLSTLNVETCGIVHSDWRFPNILLFKRDDRNHDINQLTCRLNQLSIRPISSRSSIFQSLDLTLGTVETTSSAPTAAAAAATLTSDLYYLVPVDYDLSIQLTEEKLQQYQSGQSIEIEVGPGVRRENMNEVNLSIPSETNIPDQTDIMY